MPINKKGEQYMTQGNIVAIYSHKGKCISNDSNMPKSAQASPPVQFSCSVVSDSLGP